MRRLIVFFAAAVLWAAPPQRIVSTAPSITETLFALGLGDRVVAVSQHCHYPPEAARRPKIGTYLRPNVEAIVGLHPDLVILQDTAPQAAGQMERVRLSVLRVEHGDLESVFRSIRAIADRCGIPERGVKLEAEIRGRLTAIRGRTARLPRRSLIFIVGRSPGTLDNLMAVGRGSYLNTLIEIAGGNNALAGTLMQYPRVSLESILGLNPDVLVDMGDMAETVGVTEQHKRDVVALWSRQPALKAVAQKRVYAVAEDIFVVPGPRIAEAAEAFERMLHPETAR
jgi:iron complex transport system substrate-binding protein